MVSEGHVGGTCGSRIVQLTWYSTACRLCCLEPSPYGHH